MIRRAAIGAVGVTLYPLRALWISSRQIDARAVCPRATVLPSQRCAVTVASAPQLGKVAVACPLRPLTVQRPSMASGVKR